MTKLVPPPKKEEEEEEEDEEDAKTLRRKLVLHSLLVFRSASHLDVDVFPSPTIFSSLLGVSPFLTAGFHFFAFVFGGLQLVILSNLIPCLFMVPFLFQTSFFFFPAPYSNSL